MSVREFKVSLQLLTAMTRGAPAQTAWLLAWFGR